MSKESIERVIENGELDRHAICPSAGGCSSCPDSEHCRAVRVTFGLTSEAMENHAAARLEQQP